MITSQSGDQFVSRLLCRQFNHLITLFSSSLLTWLECLFDSFAPLPYLIITFLRQKRDGDLSYWFKGVALRYNTISHSSPWLKISSTPLAPHTAWARSTQWADDGKWLGGDCVFDVINQFAIMLSRRYESGGEEACINTIVDMIFVMIWLFLLFALSRLCRLHGKIFARWLSRLRDRVWQWIFVLYSCMGKSKFQ